MRSDNSTAGCMMEGSGSPAQVWNISRTSLLSLIYKDRGNKASYHEYIMVDFINNENIYAEKWELFTLFLRPWSVFVNQSVRMHNHGLRKNAVDLKSSLGIVCISLLIHDLWKCRVEAEWGSSGNWQQLCMHTWVLAATTVYWEDIPTTYRIWWWFCWSPLGMLSQNPHLDGGGMVCAFFIFVSLIAQYFGRVILPTESGIFY